MICFLDMDGVLSDFTRAAMNVHGELYNENDWPIGEYSIEKVLGCSDVEFWQAIDAEGTWFWSDLDPYQWAHVLLDEFKSRFKEVVIVTAPSRSPHSYAGKKRWLDKYSISSQFPLVFTKRKDLLAAPGRVLIDDGDHNVKNFRAGGGMSFSFPQPWSMSWLDFQDSEYFSEHGLGRVHFLIKELIDRGYTE
ncbi:MAG: 5' nucleotidase, NT5C type [Rubripirellula sp.]